MGCLRRLLLLTLAALCMTKVHAQGLPGEFQFAPRLSIGLADVRDEWSEPQRTTSLTSGAGLNIGYLAPFFLVLEAGLQLHEEQLVLSENGDFSIAEFYIQAGLDIPLYDGWHLSPKFGRGYSQVSPIEETPGFSGILRRERTSDVYELSIRKYFDEPVALGISLRDFKLPDGHSRTVSFELVLRF